MSITWVHLSDLHFRANASSALDANVVLRALLKDLERKGPPLDGLTPDFIAVTGDIAYGGKPAEYELAGRFFDELLAKFALDKTRLFIVPGNHDSDRDAIDGNAEVVAQGICTRSNAAAVLSGPLRASLFRRLEAYAAFARGYFGAHRDYSLCEPQGTFFIESLTLDQRQVAILGLNSAFLAGTDRDLGKVLLGEHQVRTAVELAKTADLRIALLHHPFEWLRDFDRRDCAPLLLRGCHFLLHGHLHEPSFVSVSTPDSSTVVLPGGACYETREHHNSYNVVRLDTDTGRGKAFFRTYTDNQGGFWTADTQMFENVQTGVYEFKIPSLCGPAEEIALLDASAAPALLSPASLMAPQPPVPPQPLQLSLSGEVRTRSEAVAPFRKPERHVRLRTLVLSVAPLALLAGVLAYFLNEANNARQLPAPEQEIARRTAAPLNVIIDDLRAKLAKSDLDRNASESRASREKHSASEFRDSSLKSIADLEDRLAQAGEDLRSQQSVIASFQALADRYYATSPQDSRLALLVISARKLLERELGERRPGDMISPVSSASSPLLQGASSSQTTTHTITIVP